MRIILDKDSYIDVKEDPIDAVVRLSIKTKTDNNTVVIITTVLTVEQINKLITALVTLKSKI